MLYLGIAALALAVICVAAWVAVRRQRTATSRMVERLMRDAVEPRPAHASVEHTDSRARVERIDAPAPVARYLRSALPDGRRVRAVRLRQIGELRTDARSDRWMRFEAEHVAVPGAAGFVWNAKVAIAPLLHVRVRDALIAGEGSGHVSLLSAWRVAADRGTPEMQSGALHRYLAEAVWYPSALLPSERLRWSAVDEDRALATLTSGEVFVSLEFRFGHGGEVTGIYTPGRWGKFGGRYERLPWEGHFRDYREWSGLRVPAEGEVGWYIDGEWRRVWSGRIVELVVDY